MNILPDNIAELPKHIHLTRARAAFKDKALQLLACGYSLQEILNIQRLSVTSLFEDLKATNSVRPELASLDQMLALVDGVKGDPDVIIAVELMDKKGEGGLDT